MRGFKFFISFLNFSIMLDFRFIIATQRDGEEFPQLFATFATLAEAAFALGSMCSELQGEPDELYYPKGSCMEFRRGDLHYYIDEIIS